MFYHFMLPEPPNHRLSPNGRYKSTQANVRVQAEAKSLVKRFTRDAPRFPEEGKIHVTWHIFLAKGRKAWDEDNLIAALKYHQDTLAHALGVNDSRMVPEVFQYRDPSGKGFALCTVRSEDKERPGDVD